MLHLHVVRIVLACAQVTQDMAKHGPLPFKETAATFTAFLVVLAFVAVGFLTMATEAFLGIKVAAPGDWLAAMLSLASAGLGFLIGKQIDPAYSQSSFDPALVTDPSVCSCCGQKLPSNNLPIPGDGQQVMP